MRGEWTPLVLLAEQCGYTLQKQAGELLIAAPFITCGITVKVRFIQVTVDETSLSTTCCYKSLKLHSHEGKGEINKAFTAL